MESTPLLNVAGKGKSYDKNNAIQGSCYEDCVATVGSFFGCLSSYIFCCWNPYQTVDQGSALVVTRFGRYHDVYGPGLHYLRPLTDEGISVSLRTHVIDLPEQCVLTLDNLTVHIDGSIYYRVLDPQAVTFNISNLESCLNQMSVSALRSCFSNHTLQNCLEHRDKLAEEIKHYTSEHIKGWGVEVTSTIIKDIRLSEDLQRNLSAKAIAERSASAKIIEAQADVNAAHLMRDAAEALNTPAALQIRYLETLKSMASQPNNKVIFIPMNHSDNFASIASAVEGLK
jgi:regulator of protease activity HflC (stomatin/prohibitin superfamily)